MSLPVNLMSSEALSQRLADLMTARTRLDAEVQRVTAVLLVRESGEPRRPRKAPAAPVRGPLPPHGTVARYRARDAGCRCVACRAANAEDSRARRARVAAQAERREVLDQPRSSRRRMTS